MNLAELTPLDQRALELAMRYWVAHWDFECPTLFGIDLGELKDVLLHWPNVRADAEQTTAVALMGALRELLYGASTVPKAALPGLIGLSYEQADQLHARVRSVVR